MGGKGFVKLISQVFPRPLPESPLVFFPALSLALFFARAPLSERLEQAMSIINAKTSKIPRIMDLLRPITLFTLQHNFTLTAVHVPSLQYGIADSLSRFQMERFRELAPEASPTGHPNPASLVHICCPTATNPQRIWHLSGHCRNFFSTVYHPMSETLMTTDSFANQ